MKEFNITGQITINITFDIKAEAEEEALQKAKEQIKDEFHLYNEEVDYNSLFAFEYE